MAAILSLGILFVCLPAQAAHTGQSGPSSSLNDQGSGLSAVDSRGYEENEPVTDCGSGVSSRSPVPEVMMSLTAKEQKDSSAEGAQSRTVTPDAGYSFFPNPGEHSLGSDSVDNVRAGPEQDTGFPQGNRGDTTAGHPDAQVQSKGIGLLAGLVVSPGSAAATRSASGSEKGHIPFPDTNRGSAPQRHQHGSPAQSGSYPCGPAQTSPLPPASGQTRDESKEDTPSRQRSKRIGFLSRVVDPIVPDPASASFPLQSLFPFTMLLIGGYRRISKKNVLDHDARHVIYHTITATPGIDVKTLTDRTGINENTLRYHLDRLVATGKISCFTRPGVVRYFQNQGAFSLFEHTVFHYLWTDTPRGIIGLLYQHPGLTRQHIADALAISGPSVTRQMDNLIEDGIVENRFPGRSNHYYLTAEASLTIDTIMIHTPVMIHKDAEVMPVSATAG